MKSEAGHKQIQQKKLDPCSQKLNLLEILLLSGTQSYKNSIITCSEFKMWFCWTIWLCAVQAAICLGGISGAIAPFVLFLYSWRMGIFEFLSVLDKMTSLSICNKKVKIKHLKNLSVSVDLTMQQINKITVKI